MLFRSDEYISKGQLVPDNVVIDILTKFFADNPTSNGYIFDGFPRTLRQGEAMDEMLAKKNQSINVVLWLDVDDDELVERLLNRGKEMGRDDDILETIKLRLKVYYQKTAPLKEFYLKQGKLVKVNGMGTVEEIFSRIEKVIDSLNTEI